LGVSRRVCGRGHEGAGWTSEHRAAHRWKPSSVAITDHVALELDLAQYTNDDGPSITALAGSTIRVGCLPDDERFPHFAIGLQISVC